jgi:hypothetical protein
MDEPIMDPEWGIINYVKIGKYNRSTTVIKGMLSLHRDIPDTLRVSVTYSLLFKRIISFIPFNRL